jgi:hypothetical protein
MRYYWPHQVAPILRSPSLFCLSFCFAKLPRFLRQSFRLADAQNGGSDFAELLRAQEQDASADLSIRLLNETRLRKETAGDLQEMTVGKLPPVFFFIPRDEDEGLTATLVFPEQLQPNDDVTHSTRLI